MIAHAQARVRAGADADRDAGEVTAFGSGVGDHLGDRGREQLRVAVRVDGDELGERLSPVMQRYRHRRRGGIQSEQQHDVKG